MVLHRQILFSLIQKHTKHRVAPRYLKLVTFSYFLPFNANKKYLHCLCLALFCADFHSICRCSVYESVGEVLKFTTNRRLLMDFSPVEMDVWGNVLFSAWSSPETSWTVWLWVSIHDGHLLLSWRTPLADCSKGCTAGVLMYRFNCMNFSFLSVEPSEDLPQACRPDSFVFIKRLLEVYEVVEQITLML